MTGVPELPGFRTFRHDGAVFTLAAYGDNRVVNIGARQMNPALAEAIRSATDSLPVVYVSDDDSDTGLIQ